MDCHDPAAIEIMTENGHHQFSIEIAAKDEIQIRTEEKKNKKEGFLRLIAKF